MSFGIDSNDKSYIEKQVKTVGHVFQLKKNHITLVTYYILIKNINLNNKLYVINFVHHSSWNKSIFQRIINIIKKYSEFVLQYFSQKLFKILFKYKLKSKQILFIFIYFTYYLPFIWIHLFGLLYKTVDKPNFLHFTENTYSIFFF